MLKNSNHTGQTFMLYCNGLTTLQELMRQLRLQKEWDTVTRVQYDIDLDGTLKSLKVTNE